MALTVSAGDAAAQRFGGNPPSVRWNQINTDTFRVIFPRGLEQQAAEVSTLISRVAPLSYRSIGSTVRKINIVLQNQTLISNGYVGLGPYRSEFFLTPRQNSFELGSLPWNKSLALHEYRHVKQYSNFRKGLSKFFYYIFGEQGQALANSAAVPDWFFEGDAVYQETIFSSQGRGRIPYFFNPYRSLWASGKNYSWMKLRNGSYRDFVPDHYRLGYMLVAYGREKYGTDIWKNISSDAAAYKGLLYPWQKAVKKYTGQSYQQFRTAAMNSFQSAKPEATDTASSYARRFKHFNADEEFPQWIDDSTTIFVKSSFKKIPAFVTRDLNGGERKIIYKDISFDNYFSYGHQKVVYSAFRNDPRWGWRNYAVIRMLDVNSGERKTLTHRTKYLSPAISEDGKRIVAVDNNVNGRQELHVLDAANGKLISKLPNTEKLIFTYPKFFGTDRVVSAVRDKAGRMSLVLFSIADGSYRKLTPFVDEAIGFPVVNGDTISFTMSYKGHEHLFAVIDDKIFLFKPHYENNTTGNYHLAVRGDRYAWSMFTAAGFHALTGNGKLERIALEAAVERPGDLIADTSTAHPSVKAYSKNHRLFNFHSWRPYISDPEYTYSLTGENILNTFQTELYFTYNRNERFKETGASFAYGGLFPVLRAGASFILDRSFTDSAQIINWNELSANIGTSVPLSFTSGIFTQSMNFSASLNSRQVYYTGAAKSRFTDKQFNFSDLSFSFANQRSAAQQDIYPRIAQSFIIRHRAILNKYTAHQLGMSAALYFPGFFQGHSFVVQGAYQSRDTLQQYNFSNNFSLPRGYPDLNFPRMWRAGANYHFPITYPDAGFGNIVYLMRVRGNGFYDYGRIKSLRTGKEFIFRSTGLELYFDTKWWNQLPVSFGIRYSRLLDAALTGSSPNQWEFVLPLTLLSR